MAVTLRVSGLRHALICPCDSGLTHRCVGACVAYNRVSAGRSDHCGAHHLLQGSNPVHKKEAKNAAALLMGLLTLFEVRTVTRARLSLASVILFCSARAQPTLSRDCT